MDGVIDPEELFSRGEAAEGVQPSHTRLNVRVCPCRDRWWGHDQPYIENACARLHNVRLGSQMFECCSFLAGAARADATRMHTHTPTRWHCVI